MGHKQSSKCRFSVLLAGYIVFSVCNYSQWAYSIIETSTVLVVWRRFHTIIIMVHLPLLIRVSSAILGLTSAIKTESDTPACISYYSSPILPGGSIQKLLSVVFYDVHPFFWSRLISFCHSALVYGPYRPGTGVVSGAEMDTAFSTVINRLVGVSFRGSKSPASFRDSETHVLGVWKRLFATLDTAVGFENSTPDAEIPTLEEHPAIRFVTTTTNKQTTTRKLDLMKNEHWTLKIWKNGHWTCRVDTRLSLPHPLLSPVRKCELFPCAFHTECIVSTVACLWYMPR